MENCTIRVIRNEKQIGAENYKIRIVWRNVIVLTAIHSSILWLFWYLKRNPDQWINFLILNKFNFFYYVISALGITAGAHRLWAHRSYKAKAPLRLFLALSFLSAGQKDIFEWCRDHRVHHKFTETDADPYNARRGFFFSHVGWLMCRKHPDVIRKGGSVDVSDMLKDPIVIWQRKYYYPLMSIFTILLPTLFPMYYRNIPFIHCVLMSYARYAFTLNQTWLVNSVAHLYGSRPYDARIGAREHNFLNIPIQGEMYHNYHHTFPQDYKASEHGWLGQWNLAALFIDLMALISQAYDLKEVPKDIVLRRKEKAAEQNDMSSQMRKN